MLEFLDLRDRRERLEPRRFETPSAVIDTVRDIRPDTVRPYRSDEMPSTKGAL